MELLCTPLRNPIIGSVFTPTASDDPFNELDQPPALRRLRQRDQLDKVFLGCSSTPELKNPNVNALPDTPPDKYILPSTSLLHPHSTLEDEELAFQNNVGACYHGVATTRENDWEMEKCFQFRRGETSDEFFIPLPFDERETGYEEELAGAARRPRVNFRTVPPEILELPGSELSSLKSSIHSSNSRFYKNDFDLDSFEDGLELNSDCEMSKDIGVESGLSPEESRLAESRRYFVPIRPKICAEGSMDEYFGIAQLNDGFPGKDANDYGSNEKWGLDPNDFTGSTMSPPDVSYGLGTVTASSSHTPRFVQRKKARTVSIDQVSIDTRCISKESENRDNVFFLTSPRRKIRTATLAATECTATKYVAPTPIHLRGYDHDQFKVVREVDSSSDDDNQNGIFCQQLLGISECGMDDATNLQNIGYSEYHRMVHSIQCYSPGRGDSVAAESSVRGADI